MHSEFGINPPDNLFSEENSAIPSPAAPILVAIIDSGILATHQAFIREAIRWPDENDEINDSSPYGYDATTISKVQRYYPRDFHGHGTHIGGIIAGLPHRITEVEIKDKHGRYTSVPIQQALIRGVASMPGMLKILICKNVEPGIPEDGHFISRTIDCIRYARERGARVVNCSWGRMIDDSRGISKENLNTLANALRNPCELLKKNEQDKWVSHDPPQAAIPIIAVATAGNLDNDQPVEKGDRDKPDNHYYPASFNLDNVIAVAASTKKGFLAKRSCYGKQSIHVTAPGIGIISASCSGDTNYRLLSGTSMAAPYTTAFFPLMIAKFLDRYSCEKLIDHLCEKANKENLEILQVRDGRVDLAGALEEPLSANTRLELELENLKEKSPGNDNYNSP